MARHAWPGLRYTRVCLTVWTCMLLQASRMPLLFFFYPDGTDLLAVYLMLNATQ